MDESSSDINSFVIDKDPTEEDIEAARLIGFNATKKHAKTLKTMQTPYRKKQNNILNVLEASPISGLEDMSDDSNTTGETLNSSDSEQDAFSKKRLTKSNKIKPFTSNSTPFVDKNNSKSRTLYWTSLGKMTHSILQMEENIRIDFSDVDFSAPVSLTVSQNIISGCFSEFGLIIIYKQKETHSVAFRAFTGDRKLQVIKSGFSHSKVSTVSMYQQLILLTTISTSIKGKQNVYLFNIHGRELSSFISPTPIITTALSTNYITLLCSTNTQKNLVLERYKILNNKHIKKDININIPLFFKHPKFMSFDEFDNLYVFDNYSNLIMLNNSSLCLQFIFNFKIYYRDELNEYNYYPIYILNKRLFYIKQIKSKGKFLIPFNDYSLNIVELNTIHINKHRKHKKVSNHEEERNTLFGSSDGITKLEKLENEYRNISLFNKDNNEVEEDKLIIRIISELIRIKKSEGLILDYVKLLNKHISMEGAIKLCKNYNLFKISEEIENIIKERYKEDDYDISKVEINNEKEEEIKENEVNEEVEENEGNEVDIKNEEQEESVKMNKEEFVNPFKFK